MMVSSSWELSQVADGWNGRLSSWRKKDGRNKLMLVLLVVVVAASVSICSVVSYSNMKYNIV